MNLSNKRWPKFKQELIPIIYISILNTIANFKLSPFTMKLASPWNIILGTVVSVLGAIIIAYGFTFADIWGPRFAVYPPSFDEGPYQEVFKKIYRSIPIAVAHIGFFICWYKDYNRMSNAHYAADYVICITSWILLYRAMYSEPVEQ
jgi:hypothetical protein